MHTRYKQTTNHGVSFHNELQKQTLQNIVFQQFILLQFPMLQIHFINEKSRSSNIIRAIRANIAHVFFDSI